MENYKVVFDYKGEGVIYETLMSDRTRPMVEQLYVELYNRFTNEANEHIDQWNAEAEAGGLVPDIPFNWDCDYMKFMLQKYRDLLELLKNDEVFKTAFAAENEFMGYEMYIGEELEFHLIVKNETDLQSLGYLDISFYLNEEE